MAEYATLNIKVDSKGVVTGTQSLKKLEKQGKKSEKATNGLTKSFGAMGAAASLAAVATAGLFATAVIRNISDFTQAVADLAAITGAAGADLEFFAEGAKEIGRTTSLSATQAVEAYKLIASAKPDLLENAAALDAVTKSAVVLAEASGVQLPEAAKALGSALNQFGLDASKADDVINTLAASSKLGAAEVPAVTEALRNVGSAANSLGIDLVETVAGIQALAKAGRQGSDAGTGLRQVLLKLEKTGRADLMPSINGLQGALLNLKKEARSNTELMTLFGEEGFAAATALLAQSDVVVDLGKNLRGTNTAYEQSHIRMDTLKGDTDKLKAAFEGLTLETGGSLTPALRALTQAMTDLITGTVTLSQTLGVTWAKIFHGTILDSVQDVDDAIAITQGSMDSILDELEKSRVFRLNPFASTDELREDYLDLKTKMDALVKLRKDLSAPAELLPVVDSSRKTLNEETPEAEKKATRSLELQRRHLSETKKVQSDLDDSLDKTAGKFDALTSAVDGWGASFADAMMSSSGSFTDFAENMINQLQRIALQQASQPIFDAFGGFLQTGISSLLGSFGTGGVSAGQSANFATSMAGSSFAGGGSTGSGSRSGGVDGQGGFPAILHPNETVIDHSRGQSSGGNINVSVNVDSSGSSAKGDNKGLDLGKAIGIAIRAVLIEEKRNGGLLA